MSTFSLTILGTSAAVPAHGRFCSGQLLHTERESILIDCGEGIQLQLQKIGAGHGRIDTILISHLHGDHFFGLFGLLTSWMLNRRREPLLIISPPGLREMITPVIQLDKFTPPFPITFQEEAPTGLERVYRTRQLDVFAFPLRHRIPTNGYLVRELERPRSILPAKIEEYAIPYPAIPAVKAGGDFSLPGGGTVPNGELTTDPPPSRSYAHCSDTHYFPEIVEFIRDVNLLYHEATFLHEDLDRALETDHTTAHQAGLAARDARVGQLVIGHYSGRYTDIEALEAEARRVFPLTSGARELQRYTVPFVGRMKD
ncbi:MAG: ribonuclease Z [Saprospiraceae bacterium]